MNGYFKLHLPSHICLGNIYTACVSDHLSKVVQQTCLTRNGKIMLGFYHFRLHENHMTNCWIAPGLGIWLKSQRLGVRSPTVPPLRGLESMIRRVPSSPAILKL